MASIGVNFTINTRQLDKQLKKQVKKFKKTKGLFNQIAKTELKKAQSRIKSSKDTPDNQKWKPYDYNTIASGQRARNGLLWDSGNLLNSFYTNVAKTTVTIGNKARYAGYLQFGTRNMPARPYLGWNIKELGITIKDFYKWK